MQPRPDIRRITVALDRELYLRLVKAQHKLELPTMTAAIEVLLQKGIDLAKKRGQMAAEPLPENDSADLVHGGRRTIVAPKRKQAKKGE